MRSLHTCIALLLIMLPCALEAGVLKGKIKDTKGEPLPFATVFIQGTTMGTSANAEADYQLSLPPGTHRVVCQYMGFRQDVYNVTITGSETVTHNFTLQDQTLEMKTVTIKANGEDPAYPIIRKTIAKRSLHLQQIKSLQTGVYLKGVFRNRAMPDKIIGISINDGNGSKQESAKSMGLDTQGRGVLYLVEQFADYYSRGSQEKTIIRSVRESGDPQGFGSSRLPSVISFYENNINIFDGINPRGFVSPISDNALHFYKYKYEGEFHEGGYVINKIKVTPKRQYEPLFQGTIYIAEEDWVIHSLDLLVTQKNNLELLDTIRLKQTHLPLKKDTWVIKNQVFYPTIKILGFDLAGYFLTVYDKQKINEPIPDSVFAGNIISTYDKDANKKDTSYWTDTRPTPLEDDEVRDYTFRDSVRAVQDDPVHRDSMRRKSNSLSPMGLLTGGIHYAGKDYKFRLFTNSVLNPNDGLVNFNSVEGVVVSPKLWWFYTNKNKEGQWRGVAAARYGFSNTHFNAMGRISYRKNDKEWRGRYWEFGGEGGKYVFQFNPDAISPLYNTVTTLMYGRNHMKLYERWTGSLFFDQDFGNGFSWNAKTSFQRRLPLENTTDYAFRKSKRDEITPNNPPELAGYPWEVHNAVLLKVGLAYRPGTQYVQYPDYKMPIGSDWPLFRLSYEKGIPNILDSKTDFDKWEFKIEDDVRLKLAGTMSYNISVGGFLNKKYVSLPDLKHLDGNQVLLASPYLNSFQLAPYYAYSNTADIYGQLHLEYYLKGLLTNKIPLLRQAKWYLVLGTNSFYAGDDSYYAEAFAGIDNLGYKWFRFLRVDFVKSWDSYKHSTTGIRVGLNLNAFGGSNTGATERTDW